MSRVSKPWMGFVGLVEALNQLHSCLLAVDFFFDGELEMIHYSDNQSGGSSSSCLSKILSTSYVGWMQHYTVANQQEHQVQ
ncbi:hypothetical protein BVRB_1g016160 [Beta vulgaris subsp. vulgaris]|nr:hypothetical protein BVRB_1g016160 [Beta vulgaris subsp. vulgaris]